MRLPARRTGHLFSALSETKKGGDETERKPQNFILVRIRLLANIPLCSQYSWKFLKPDADNCFLPRDGLPRQKSRDSRYCGKLLSSYYESSRQSAQSVSELVRSRLRVSLRQRRTKIPRRNFIISTAATNRFYIAEIYVTNHLQSSVIFPRPRHWFNYFRMHSIMSQWSVVKHLFYNA